MAPNPSLQKRLFSPFPAAAASYRHAPGLIYTARYMDYCHPHNLLDPDPADRDRHYGIRVTLPPGDTLSRLLGEHWERLHWYASEAQRDAAFAGMAERHGYYRKTDAPTQVLEKIQR